MSKAKIKQAAAWIREADGLLIAAGAGMGVDSGLPDFRGSEGFWAAYPALRGQDFSQVANPRGFADDPTRAWGFYGHRLDLYRKTVPHAGFSILKSWGAKMKRGSFVFTSNVDGQFQKAGFAANRIVECHGSIHHLQCVKGCLDAVWSAGTFVPEIDAENCRLLNEAPTCPHCGSITRPNILMFGDRYWIGDRTDAQRDALQAWLNKVDHVVVVEMGAGAAIPTVRWFSESNGPRVIRINPRDYDIHPSCGIGIKGGARAVLEQIAELV